MSGNETIRRADVEKLSIIRYPDPRLREVCAAVDEVDQSVRDAGYRALANWPDATVADELLDIAKTSEVASYRVWSLRAYARVVSMPNERPPQQTFEMLKSVMELANRWMYPSLKP